MYELSYFRNNLDAVAARLADRGFTMDLEAFRKLDAERRQAVSETEALKAQKADVLVTTLADFQVLALADQLATAGVKLAIVGGDTEIMIESFGYLAEALLMAVIFVYLILAAQFESFIDPLSIMLSLPLSIVGMAGMLKLTGDTISIMSLIGLIMLIYLGLSLLTAWGMNRYNQRVTRHAH